MGIDLKALPPEEAIAYFAAKGHALDPSFSWHDWAATDHATAFTVAKSTGFDILKDIHDGMLAALKDGTGERQFIDRLTPILQAKGWWGRQDVRDPATGEIVTAQLGSVRRLKTIFDTNLRMAYGAARWNQLQRSAHSYPYLRYTAVLDSRTRPMHRLWHGTILPIGHAWWRTHFPPCGWYCRCSVHAVSEHDLARYGWKISVAPPVDPEPPRLYSNPRTGQVTEVPAGIDPGFAFNPGEVALDQHAARLAVLTRVDAPPRLTAAAHADTVRFLTPLVTRDFGSWLDTLAGRLATGEPGTVGDQRVVGALTDPVLEFLAARGIDPMSGAVTVSDTAAVHMLRDAKSGRGAAVPVDVLRRLPDILAKPERILFDTADPALVYVFRTDGGQLGKLVVRVGFGTKDRRRRVITNSARTAGIVQEHDLANARVGDTARYLEVSQPPGGTPLSP